MAEPADERRTRIAQAFIAACRDEIEAPKPGNVHLFADGHRMTAGDFLRSAEAAAGPLTAEAGVGARILGAVEATFATVGTNTNLGIVLLCAPLAAAAGRPSDLRPALVRVLAALDVGDAEAAFRAIRRASPAGLGRAERHDVHAPAAVSLREAMAEAAERDSIARQYVTDFTDVFDLGEPTLARAQASADDPRAATLAVYLAFLAALPDSHIVRKHGTAAAARVQKEAAAMRERVGARPFQAVLADVLSWDSALKRDGLNPGTSADLTVATLFAHRLRNLLPSGLNSD